LINDRPKPNEVKSFDKAIEKLHSNMDKWKTEADNFGGKGKNLMPSDRKKMLVLPFMLSKRSELPEPKKGQKEWNIFYDLFDEEWDAFEGLSFDPEEKITEFNYEKFIPKHILSSMDTASEEFKTLVKMMNLSSSTKYE
jgi:hypothetical protein